MSDAPLANDRLDSLQYCLTRYGALVPNLRFRSQAVDEWRREAKAKLEELIGPFPPRRVALEPKFSAVEQGDGYTRRTVTFTTRPDLAAFAYVLVPNQIKTPAPAIICLPGHGRGVDEIAGIDENGQDREHLDGYQHDFAVQCARQGFVTLALEPLGFGRRRDGAARERGAAASSCQPAAGAALLLGESMVGWRVWDAWRAIDLLETLPDVDPKRVGMMGISGGGTVILYAAALDERVKAAVLSGSFCTFKDSIYSISHCIDNYVPGLLKWFEAADVASLIAPRYLFCEAGTEDPIFPQPGVTEAVRAVERTYSTLNAAGNFGHVFFKAGHSFDGVEAFKALRRWL
jgi:dienelactone hydrolase